MRISINDLLELFAIEAAELDTNEEQPDYGQEETVYFNNNTDAIRQLFEESMMGKDYRVAYDTVLLANSLQINLLQKA